MFYQRVGNALQYRSQHSSFSFCSVLLYHPLILVWPALQVLAHQVPWRLPRFVPLVTKLARDASMISKPSLESRDVTEPRSASSGNKTRWL